MSHDFDSEDKTKNMKPQERPAKGTRRIVLPWDQESYATPAKSESSRSPSLAGTRSKRSLKVPARFNDSEFAYQDVASNTAEALRSKSSRETRQHNQASKRSELKALAIKTALSKGHQPQSSPRQRHQKQQNSPNRTTATTSAESPIKSSDTSNNKRPSEDSVEEIVKLKGAFRPSVTFKKQAISFSENTLENNITLTPTRPLVEQVPNAASETPPTVANNRHSSNRKRSSQPRKKPESHRLIAKQKHDQHGSLHDMGGSGCGDVVINNITSQQPHQSYKPQLQQLLQQPIPQNLQYQPQTRHIHASPQYGTRLLPIDQPIYLPLSVGNIAPITATMPLISSMARRPPFISKRAAACLKYQESMRMNTALSIHKALVRITRYLGVRDRLMLRCVSKTWRSIVDSEEVWRKILVDQNDGFLDWNKVEDNLKYFKGATHVMFDKYKPASSINLDHANVLCSMTKLRRLWFRTVDCEQNTSAFRILKIVEQKILQLKPASKEGKDATPMETTWFMTNGEIRWHVRVGIDNLGIATVDMYKQAPRTYTKLTDQDKDIVTSVELYDLRADFDWASKAKLATSENDDIDIRKVANVIISPI